MNKSYYPFVGLMAGVALFFTACVEDLNPVLPADGNIAYVNFVNAAEAILYGQNDTLQRYNNLYINDSINNPPFDNYNDRAWYPFEFPESTIDIRQCPRHFTGVSAITVGGNADVYWLPLEGGDYRFIYTSKNKTYLYTAEESLKKSTYQMLYLVESPETDSSYTVVNVPIERKERVEERVIVQLVNLSPDAGGVEVYRVDANGNEMATATINTLTFGQYASTEFSTEGTKNSYNSILLRFRTPGGNDLQSIAVPANNGAVYTLLLRGFINQTKRSVQKDNETMTTVTVLPNLRCSLRRVFY